MTNYNSKAMCCLVHKKDRQNSLQLVIDNRRRVWYSCGKNYCKKWYNPPDDDKNKDRSDAFDNLKLSFDPLNVFGSLTVLKIKPYCN